MSTESFRQVELALFYLSDIISEMVWWHSFLFVKSIWLYMTCFVDPTSSKTTFILLSCKYIYYLCHTILHFLILFSWTITMQDLRGIFPCLLAKIQSFIISVCICPLFWREWQAHRQFPYVIH
jgi:hypothetical protein